MKILYAIQATGNGHISRAREIVPLLQQYGTVDLLVSGTQADMELEQQVKYRFHGFSFIFGQKGGVNHWKTWKSMNLFKFIRDMKSLPLGDYQLIINDFEPVTAWACKIKGIESVGLSHQASFQSPLVPKSKSIDWAQLVMKYYAPASHYVGFHFHRYDHFIHTPVIRTEIRNLIPGNQGHYTVYLPSIADKWLVSLLKQMPEIKWEIFSKHCTVPFIEKNIRVLPIDNEDFNYSLSNCTGLLTGGGFEGPAEALFLRKKLLVVPMKFQYEQQCNAYALKQFGIPVIWGSNPDWLPIIRKWVQEPQFHQFEFPDETAALVKNLVEKYQR